MTVGLSTMSRAAFWAGLILLAAAYALFLYGAFQLHPGLGVMALGGVAWMIAGGVLSYYRELEGQRAQLAYVQQLKAQELARQQAHSDLHAAAHGTRKAAN